MQNSEEWIPLEKKDGMRKGTDNNSMLFFFLNQVVGAR